MNTFTYDISQDSRREILILKLDFAKAFDTIEHPTIFLMIEHLFWQDNEGTTWLPDKVVYLG
jgi:hypothetical protein